VAKLVEALMEEELLAAAVVVVVAVELMEERLEVL